MRAYGQANSNQRPEGTLVDSPTLSSLRHLLVISIKANKSPSKQTNTLRHLHLLLKLTLGGNLLSQWLHFSKGMLGQE